MKNYTSLLFIGLASLSMLLSSCDPSTRHRKIVMNNSDYDIVIFPNIIEANYGYQSDSIFIGKHSHVTILENGGISKVYEYEDCSVYVDSIHSKIVGHDSLKLSLNLADKTNWFFSVLKKTFGEGGNCECRTVIRNEDIQ